MRIFDTRIVGYCCVFKSKRYNVSTKNFAEKFYTKSSLTRYYPVMIEKRRPNFGLCSRFMFWENFSNLKFNSADRKNNKKEAKKSFYLHHLTYSVLSHPKDTTKLQIWKWWKPKLISSRSSLKNKSALFRQWRIQEVLDADIPVWAPKLGVDIKKQN